MQVVQIFNSTDLDDLLSVMAHIDGFFEALDVESAAVDPQAVKSIIQGMKQDFPHVDGLEKASCFKKASNFLCYFISTGPIATRIPSEAGDLSKFDPNIVVGFDLALSSLYKAKIDCKDGSVKHVDNEIEITSHSYFDILGALKNITPRDHFSLVAVLLEQIVYKTNPECQYTTKAYSG